MQQFLFSLASGGLLILTACASPTPPLPTPPPPIPTALATLTPTATATLTPVPPTPTPAQTPTRLATSTLALHLPPTITELAKGFGGPDDLALMSDGAILFSDVGNGTVNRIAPNSTVTTLLRGLAEPEGIVVLADGSLIIAEQAKNRLVHFRPQSGQPATTWLELENKTGKAGVDNIVLDAARGDIIVPDSPNGTVLRVNVESKRVRVIASGFTRPTGADIERDGSIVIADEFGNAVKRIRADGRIETLGEFATPDDVVVDAAGNLFVASLGDNSVRMIDARNGTIVLIARAQQPQGIIVDADGNLIVAEFGLNRVVRIKIR